MGNKKLQNNLAAFSRSPGVIGLAHAHEQSELPWTHIKKDQPSAYMGKAMHGVLLVLVVEASTSLTDDDHLREKDSACNSFVIQDHLREMDILFNSLTDYSMEGNRLRDTSKEHWQGNHQVVRFRPNFRRFQRQQILEISLLIIF